MATKSEDLNAVLTAVECTPERSPLFWWLVKHHDELVAAADGNRMRWAPLCARFAALGLTDTTGKHATPRGAREAWLQARAYVSKRRAARQVATAPKVQPSRLPATWQPTPTPIPTSTPRAPAAARTEPPRRTESPSDLEADLPEDVRANLAALDSQFAWADRFVNPPKKKD